MSTESAVSPNTVDMEDMNVGLMEEEQEIEEEGREVDRVTAALLGELPHSLSFP